MTIVLQHQFWDLKLDDGRRRFSVGLSFGGVPSTLVIPLAAVTGFADPQVRYGLRFQPIEPETPEPPRRRRNRRAEPAAGRRRRSRPRRRRWSAWTRSAAARRPTRAEGRSDERSDAPRPSGFLLLADVPAGAGHDAVAQARHRRASRTATCDGQTRAAHRARGADRTRVPGVPRRVASAAARRIWRSCAPSSTIRRPVANDRFVALDLLKNANIAAGGVLPMCQDTGTAIVFGKKGQRVWVDGDEEEALRLGRASHLHRDQSALFADGAAVDVRGGEHRQQPAGAVRHHGRARRAPRRRVPSDVRRQGRRLGQQDVSCSRKPARSCRRRSC